MPVTSCVLSIPDWYKLYARYVAEEFGSDLFDKYLADKKMPTAKLIMDAVMTPEDYPYAMEHVIAHECQPPLQRAPVEPGSSPFWTDATCSEAPPHAVLNKNNEVVVLIADKPGKMWSFIVSDLKELKTPQRDTGVRFSMSRRLPFWASSLHWFSSIMDSLLWVTRRFLRKDGIVMPARHLRWPSLWTIPSWMSRTRSLKAMRRPWPLCSVFAFLPGSPTSPPTLFNITWKLGREGVYRAANTPKWQDLFRGLRACKPDTETMYTQIHASDLAQLPFARKLRWLIEFPPGWKWFPAWAPGGVPPHFIDPNIWPEPSLLSSTPSQPANSMIAASTGNSVTHAHAMSPTCSTSCWHDNGKSRRPFALVMWWCWHARSTTNVDSNSDAEPHASAIQRSQHAAVLVHWTQQWRVSAALPQWATALAPVSETSADQIDNQHGQKPWSPPDGYQSSTSTQRQADAAKNDQFYHERSMDEETYDECWYTMWGDIYWACPSFLSNKQHDFWAIVFVHLASQKNANIHHLPRSNTHCVFLVSFPLSQCAMRRSVMQCCRAIAMSFMHRTMRQWGSRSRL